MSNSHYITHTYYNSRHNVLLREEKYGEAVEI